MDLFADAEGLFLQIGQKLLAAVLETKDLPLQFFHPFEQGREANAEGGLEIDARALLVFDPIDFFGELAGNVVYDCEDFLIAESGERADRAHRIKADTVMLVGEQRHELNVMLRFEPIRMLARALRY